MVDTVVRLTSAAVVNKIGLPSINSGIVRASGTYGGSGLWNSGGFVYEPYLSSKVQGENGRRIFFEMANTDSTIRAMLMAIKLPIRTVAWHMEPASQDEAGKKWAEFGESIITDMATPWNDVLSEVLTEVEYGWSALEMVLKRRNDGMIGVADLQPRSQDTLYRWDFDEAGNVTAMHQQLAASEAVIPAERLALFRTEVHKNSPEGRSAILSSVKDYREIQAISHTQVTGIDRDMTGIPVLYAPSAAINDPATKPILQKIVRDVRWNDQSGMVLPSDLYADPEGKPTAVGHYRIELISSPGKRSLDPDAAITRRQSNMARSVLADFIMLGLASKGSYGLSRDKSEMFEKSLQSFVSSIEECFDRAVTRRIWAMNALDPKLKPRWKAGRLIESNLAELGGFLQSLGAAGISVANDDREKALMELAGLPVGELGTDGSVKRDKGAPKVDLKAPENVK